MISRQKVILHTLILYSPKLVTWAVGYIALTSVLRLAGAAAYGEYVLVNSYWTFLAAFSGSMMGGASQKILAEGQYLGEGKSRFFHSLKLMAGVTVVLLVAGVVFSYPFGRFVLHSEILQVHWLAGLGLLIGLTLQNYLRFALRSLQRIKIMALMDSAESLLRNLLWLSAVGVFYVGVTSLVSGAALAVVSATVLALGFLFWTFKSMPKRDSSIDVHATVVKLAPSFAVILTCNYVIGSLPSLVINYFQTKEIVGAYAAIYRVMDMVNGPVSTLGAVLAPLTSGAALHSEQMLQKILKRSFQVSILTCPLLTVVFLSRDLVINLIGLRDIDGTSATMGILCLFMLFAGFSHLFGNYADYLGYTRQRSKLMIAFAIVYALTLVATAKWGSIYHIALGSTLVFGAMISCYFFLIAENHTWNFVLENTKLLTVTLTLLAFAAVMVMVLSSPIGSTDMAANFVELIKRSAIFVMLFSLPFLSWLRWQNGRWWVL